jgi:hypothetical protein
MLKKLLLAPAFLCALTLGVPSRRLEAQQVETRLNEPEGPAGASLALHAAGDLPLPAPSELLAKSDDAVGGLAAWNQTTSRRMKGVFQTEDASVFVAIEILEKSPNKSLSKITLPNGVVVREVCDGRNAWIENSLRQYQEFTGAMLASRLRRADFNDHARLEKMASTGKVIGIEKVGTHNAYVLEFSPEKKLLSRVYIDVDSKLTVRTEDVFTTADGPYTVRLDMDDYRDVNGLKFPFRIKRTEKGAIINIRLTQVTVDPPLDDSLFLKPDFAK